MQCFCQFEYYTRTMECLTFQLNFLGTHTQAFEEGGKGGGGGHDPVSHTNFNKIHTSRTVLRKISRITKFNINEHQSKLQPYLLSLKQRSQEAILVFPEKGCGSRFIIANTAIIKIMFLSRCSQLRCRSQCSSVNQVMSSTRYAIPFAVYYDGIVVENSGRVWWAC